MSHGLEDHIQGPKTLDIHRMRSLTHTPSQFDSITHTLACEASPKVSIVAATEIGSGQVKALSVWVTVISSKSTLINVCM